MGVSINLLPPGLQRQLLIKKKLRVGFVYWGRNTILALEGLSLLLLLLNLGLFLEFKRVEGRLLEKRAILRERVESEREIRSFQKKGYSFTGVERNRRLYTPLLQTLAELLPKEISFSTLQLGKEGIKMTARASSGKSFIYLIHNLLSSPTFKEIVLTESAFLPGENVYRFSISIPTVAEAAFK